MRGLRSSRAARSRRSVCGGRPATERGDRRRARRSWTGEESAILARARTERARQGRPSSRPTRRRSIFLRAGRAQVASWSSITLALPQEMVRRAPQTSPDPTVNFARGYEVIRQDALHENREPPPRETFRGPRAFFLLRHQLRSRHRFRRGRALGRNEPGTRSPRASASLAPPNLVGSSLLVRDRRRVRCLLHCHRDECDVSIARRGFGWRRIWRILQRVVTSRSLVCARARSTAGFVSNLPLGDISRATIARRLCEGLGRYFGMSRGLRTFERSHTPVLHHVLAMTGVSSKCFDNGDARDSSDMDTSLHTTGWPAPWSRDREL